MSKNWHKSNTYLPKYEEVVVCLYRSVFPIDGSDFCVRFNHRSNNPEVVTTEMWRKGTSGITAIKNSPYYFLEALEMCKEKGLLDKFMEKI